jgi:3-hydroxymyristoyl/3-hydroxydecanoyl-(acyl carrier protein) dehydratase
VSFTLLAHSQRDQAQLFVVRVEQDSPYFSGHFPSHPVLPGIAQLALVRELLLANASESLWIASIDAVKFVKPILPGDELSVRLERRGTGGAVAFRIQRDEILLSEGRVRMQVEGLS